MRYTLLKPLCFELPVLFAPTDVSGEILQYLNVGVIALSYCFFELLTCGWVLANEHAIVEKVAALTAIGVSLHCIKTNNEKSLS